MKRFDFDTGQPNANRKNGATYHGAMELYPDFGPEGCCSLDIRGPAGAFRGSAVIDKATARKLGAALLQWSGFKVDLDLLIPQIDWLASLTPWTEEQEGLLNLLGAIRDLIDPV